MVIQSRLFRTNMTPIATSFVGIWTPKEPWKEAHKDWFAKYAKQLGEPELKEWADKDDYYTGMLEIAKHTTAEE